MVHGEALCQVDALYAEVKSASPETLTYILLGLSTYFTVNALPKKKRAMRHGMRNTHVLKVRRYAAYLVDPNEYLAVLPGAKISENICVTELNIYI